MAEPHAEPDLEQAGVGGGCRGFCPDPEPFSRSPHQQRFTDRIGRRELHQASGVSGKSLEPAPEAVLDTACERQCAGQSEPAGELGGCRAAYQLELCQGVAAGLGDDLVADSGVQWPGEHRVQQCARVGLAQTLQEQFG